MRRLRSDPKYFEDGTPMGFEVLQWLQVGPSTVCPEAGPSGDTVPCRMAGVITSPPALTESSNHLRGCRRRTSGRTHRSSSTTTSSLSSMCVPTETPILQPKPLSSNRKPYPQVARLKPEELARLADEHEELCRSGRRGEMGGGLKRLELVLRPHGPSSLLCYSKVE